MSTPNSLPDIIAPGTPRSEAQALNDIRSIRAANRARFIARRPIQINMRPEDARRVSVIYNHAERIECWLLRYPHPTGEQIEAFASVLYDAQEALR